MTSSINMSVTLPSATETLDSAFKANIVPDQEFLLQGK